MAFQNGSYATIWEVKPSEKYTDVRLSTSRKRKDTGAYETDFSGFVRFIGSAHQKAASLKEKDRIRLGEISVTRTYDKVRDTNYTNFQCFSFEFPESQPSSSPKEYNVSIPEGVDEELPFS